METDPFDMSLGDLGVKTTHGRGHTAEEIANMATDKLISVSDTAPEPIRAQAHAFKNQCHKIIAYYMREAIQSDRTTLINELNRQGHEDVAEIIRRL